MNLPELPANLQAPLDDWQRAHLPMHVERLSKSPVLPWFVGVCGWHVGVTERAATALCVAKSLGIDPNTAALFTARQLRDECMASYDRMHAAHRRETYPTKGDLESESGLLALNNRLHAFIAWVRDLP